MTIIIRNARVVAGPADTEPIPQSDVVIEGGRIISVAPSSAGADAHASQQRSETVIDARGRVLMPAFIDAHTHACWAGERLDEWEARLATRRSADVAGPPLPLGEGLGERDHPADPPKPMSGNQGGPSPGSLRSPPSPTGRGSSDAAPSTDRGRSPSTGSTESSYLQRLKSGGGIMATVRAVRAASQQELADNLRARLEVMLREGTTTVEVKSGYGLTTRDELKMLRAIADAAADFPGSVISTALLGHAVDPDQPRFFETTIEDTLPAVSREFPSVAIDAYCEAGAWPVEQCRRLFERARALGHPIRVHADQFHALGMTLLAIELGARSVDHLEATPADQLAALARSQTFGVMLPASGFHLDDRYADGRAFLDAGGNLVIASNCNPGSAPTSSMPFVVALAIRKLGLTARQAIAACTSTPADLLGFADRGEIAPGNRADLILLRHRDERLLAHELGGDPVDVVICNGAIVRQR